MATDITNATKLILSCFEHARICCRICESYSTEAGVPHFRDLIHGVWSSASAGMNPFRTPNDALRVRQWFEWRLALIARVVDLAPYRTIAWLQQRRNLYLATEAVDSLADQAGLEGILYLNGRVEKERCFGCGWSPVSGEPDARNHRCQRCAGELWPDVAMFGSNTQEATRERWSQHLADSQVHILIGITDAPRVASGNATVLTVDAEGLQITTRTSGERLRTEALEGYLNAGLARAGIAARPSPGLDSMAATTPTHRSLLALCRLIDAGAAR